MIKPQRIAILSDSCFFSTGYANQAVTLANQLSIEGHEVHYLANGFMGQTIQPGCRFLDGKTLNFTIHGNGRENYFKDLLPYIIKTKNIDVLIILLDTFMLYPWIMQLDLAPAKVIFWYPSDGGSGMPLGCDQILRFVQYPVAMAKFGQKQVKDMYDINALHIPHGVETSNFYPLSDEERVNAKKRWGLEGKFVVGSVFRNQGRKMADRTIKAFALFAKKCPEAILFLHTDPYDQAQVFDMSKLIERYGIQNRIVFTGMNFFKGFDYKQMNEVYNVMDCFILTTSGEGFGIPIIEAMACGVPTLVTDYTTTKELVKDTKSGLAIKLVGQTEEVDVHEYEILEGTITGSWNVERGICSLHSACEALEILKNNPDMRKQMGKNGVEAVKKIYSWDIVKKQWTDLINKIGEKL